MKKIKVAILGIILGLVSVFIVMKLIFPEKLNLLFEHEQQVQKIESKYKYKLIKPIIAEMVFIKDTCRRKCNNNKCIEGCLLDKCNNNPYTCSMYLEINKLLSGQRVNSTSFVHCPGDGLDWLQSTKTCPHGKKLSQKEKNGINKIVGECILAWNDAFRDDIDALIK